MKILLSKPPLYVLQECQQSENQVKKKVCNEVLPWHIRENITIEEFLISMYISSMLLLFSHYKALHRAKFEYDSVSQLNDSIIRGLKNFDCNVPPLSRHVLAPLTLICLGTHVYL